jgi:ABC-2 type transport system ATP-binding protein
MIEVEGLCKRFGALDVLRDVSFAVPTGSLCGFIGPNGAGKTTTMRILATLEEPSAGSVRVAGIDVLAEPDRARNCLGYSPDYYGSYSDLTAGEYLDFFARAQRLRAQQRRERVNEIVEFSEVGPLLELQVETLSKGQKQRLSLARALLSDPALLILDEPAAGLDPRARLDLRELLKVLCARGKTVFISSHILSELAELIDWVVIIDRGRIRHAGAPELASEHPDTTTYDLELASDEAAARKFLLEQASVRAVDGGEGVLAIRVDESAEKIEELLARMIGAGIRLRQLRRRENDLEDVFMRVTRSSHAPG